MFTAVILIMKLMAVQNSRVINHSQQNRVELVIAGEWQKCEGTTPFSLFLWKRNGHTHIHKTLHSIIVESMGLVEDLRSPKKGDGTFYYQIITYGKFVQFTPRRKQIYLVILYKTFFRLFRHYCELKCRQFLYKIKCTGYMSNLFTH